MDAGSAEVLRWDLPSDLRWLGVIDAALQEIGQELAWEPREIGQIQIACMEAVSNAIEHGNGFSPRRRVQVELRAAEERLCFRVIDEGKGFDAARLKAPHPDPADPSFLSVRGRGLFIMRAIMDEVRVRWNQGDHFIVELEKAVKRAGGGQS